MKKSTLLLSTLLAASLNAADHNAPNESKSVKMEGVGYIKQLGGTLKVELEKHMKADPTGAAAFGFCAAKATEMTQDLNKELPAHAKVRRTALKTRNEINNPDATDITVMQSYIQEIEKKTFNPENDIKVVEEGNTTRVYKPLLTSGACLKCHGQNMSNEINEMITNSYPKDQAVGFKEGDLRGVIVAEIKKASEK